MKAVLITELPPQMKYNSHLVNKTITFHTIYGNNDIEFQLPITTLIKKIDSWEAHPYEYDTKRYAFPLKRVGKGFTQYVVSEELSKSIMSTINYYLRKLKPH